MEAEAVDEEDWQEEPADGKEAAAGIDLAGPFASEEATGSELGVQIHPWSPKMIKIRKIFLIQWTVTQQ